MSHFPRSFTWMTLVVMLGASTGGGAVWLFSRIDPNRLRTKPVPVVARPVAAKVPPAVTYRLGHHRVAFKFRIEDAASHSPLNLARVRVENLNLAAELGADSEAVTSPDGHAHVSHAFLAFEERRDVDSTVHVSFQGPWISVSCAGFETRKLPLSELLSDLHWHTAPDVFMRFPRPPDVVVELKPGPTKTRPLSELAGAYTYQDDCAGVLLRIATDGTYQYSYWNDTGGQLEFRGTCSAGDGALRLTPTGPYSSSVGYLAGDYIPIDWGNRVFLVPEKERLLFCSAANGAFIPRCVSRGPGKAYPGPFARRTLEGVPIVPREWKPFLLTQPVVGSITELISQDRVMIDKGAKDGIRAGMLIVRANDTNSPHYTVLYVEDGRCLIKDLRHYDPIVEHFRYPDPFPLVLGRKMSTRSPVPDTK
jgi:hypothetical protein